MEEDSMPKNVGWSCTLTSIKRVFLDALSNLRRIWHTAINYLNPLFVISAIHGFHISVASIIQHNNGYFLIIKTTILSKH